MLRVGFEHLISCHLRERAEAKNNGEFHYIERIYKMSFYFDSFSSLSNIHGYVIADSYLFRTFWALLLLIFLRGHTL
jgi:hypothetical protein